MIGTQIAEWHCKSIKITPKKGSKYIVDPANHLIEKWMGFYKTQDEAQDILENKTKMLGEKFRIVSSSKQLIDNNLQNKKGFFLFKFTIVKAPKDK